MTEGLGTLLRPARAVLIGATGAWDRDQRQPCTDFAAWCAAHSGSACRLWIMGDGLSDVVGEPGAPLARVPLRLPWARRLLGHYHGEQAATWSLLPWRRFSALGVTALRSPSLDSLQSTAAAHGVKLLSLRPLWPLLLQRLLERRPALRRAATARAWLLEVDGETGLATCCTLSQGRLTGISRRRLAAPWTAHLQALIDEVPGTGPMAALLVGDAPPGPLPLDRAETVSAPFTGLLPRRERSAPDFLHPAPRPGLLAWAALATALPVLAAAAWSTQAAWQAREAALAIAAPVQRSARRAEAPRPENAALLNRLAHPWREVFAAGEAAPAGLQWLRLDHRATGDLRLQGVAPDDVPVRRTADALRNNTAWGSVLVSRLEQQPAGGLQFEIVARLAREAAP